MSLVPSASFLMKMKACLHQKQLFTASCLSLQLLNASEAFSGLVMCQGHVCSYIQNSIIDLLSLKSNFFLVTEILLSLLFFPSYYTIKELLENERRLHHDSQLF